MLEHVLGTQRSIPQENQHHHQEGVLIIQLYQPSGRGLGSNASITPLLSALRKAGPGGLFFKNVTSAEKGTSGHWFQTNIEAQFDYNSVEP